MLQKISQSHPWQHNRTARHRGGPARARAKKIGWSRGQGEECCKVLEIRGRSRPCKMLQRVLECSSSSKNAHHRQIGPVLSSRENPPTRFAAPGAPSRCPALTAPMRRESRAWPLADVVVDLGSTSCSRFRPRIRSLDPRGARDAGAIPSSDLGVRDIRHPKRPTHSLPSSHTHPARNPSNDPPAATLSSWRSSSAASVSATSSADDAHRAPAIHPVEPRLRRPPRTSDPLRPSPPSRCLPYPHVPLHPPPGPRLPPLPPPPRPPAPPPTVTPPTSSRARRARPPPCRMPMDLPPDSLHLADLLPRT